MHVDANQFFRGMFGHFLDVHAAGGGNHEGNAAGFAIQNQAQVDLTDDLRPQFDIDLVNRESLGPCLMGHKS